jgi:hypothetical protein
MLSIRIYIAKATLLVRQRQNMPVHVSPRNSWQSMLKYLHDDDDDVICHQGGYANVHCGKVRSSNMADLICDRMDLWLAVRSVHW